MANERAILRIWLLPSAKRLLLGLAAFLVAWLPFVSSAQFRAPGSAAAGQPKRHIVFLVDVSRSMTSSFDPVTKQPRKTNLQDELSGARARADQILASLEDAPDVDVTFWEFGERDRFARRGAVFTPVEARGQLEAFFSSVPSRFAQNWTYIAHSLFRVTGEVLGLADWTPDRDIPGDGGSVFAFVLTDGAEDFGQPFDNRPYVDWQQRQQNRTQLVWRKWTLFGDRKDWSLPVDRARPSYAVVQMLPTVSPLNLSRLPVDNIVRLERVPSHFVLVPQVLAQASDRTVHVNGDYRTAVGTAALCTAHGVPGSTPRRTLSVQANVDWQPAGAAQDTPPWEADAPPRTLVQQPLVVAFNSRPGAAIPPERRLEPGQRFPVRLDRAELCAELGRAYPDSTFVLPQTDEDASRLPPLGFIEVYRRPVYKFLLSTLEGTVPTAPFESLRADRWHVFNGVTRRYHMTAESPVEAEVEFTTNVLESGAPVASATQMVALRPSDDTGPSGDALSVTVSPARAVAVSVPPAPQNWRDTTLGRGFRWPPGAYTLRVCATPRLHTLPADSYEIESVCQGCAANGVSTNAGTVCADATLDVAPLPWSWWRLAGIVVASVGALWAWWRWAHRPRFRARLRVGILSQSRDLRAAQEAGLGGMWATFMRRPGYIELLAGGRSVYMRRFLTDAKANPNVVLGVSPNPATPQADILIWCAALPATDAETQVMCAGRELQLAGPTPDPYGALVVHVSYASLPTTVSIHSPNGRPGSNYKIELS